MESACDGVRLQQVLSPSKIYPPDDATLARAIRPRENCKARHPSGRCLLEFSEHFVILISRNAVDETDLKFSTVRLLHDVDVSLCISIKDRNARAKGIKPGLCYHTVRTAALNSSPKNSLAAILRS